MRSRTIQIVIELDDRGVEALRIRRGKAETTHVEAVGVATSRGIGRRILLEYAGALRISDQRIYARPERAGAKSRAQIVHGCDLGGPNSARSRRERIDFATETDDR